jgi:hypothetical protein
MRQLYSHSPEYISGVVDAAKLQNPSSKTNIQFFFETAKYIKQG